MMRISKTIVNTYGKNRLADWWKASTDGKASTERLLVRHLFKQAGCVNLPKMNAWQVGQVVRFLKKEIGV